MDTRRTKSTKRPTFRKQEQGETKRMTKVTVRIHKDDGSVVFKTKKIEDDGKVSLRRKSKYEREWRPKVSWKEEKHGRFGRVKYYTDVFQDATETFQMNVKAKTVERPELEQKEVTRYAKSKVFEKRYMTDSKQTSSFILYAILIIQIVGLVLTFLLSSGRLRL